MKIDHAKIKKSTSEVVGIMYFLQMIAIGRSPQKKSGLCHVNRKLVIEYGGRW